MRVIGLMWVNKLTDIYGGLDPREVPRYGIADAAHYLRLPATTLVQWVRGRSFPTKDGAKRLPAVIRVPHPPKGMLTFTNLVEAYVLASIRRRHEIPLQAVRRALSFVEKELGVKRPLVEEQFFAHGGSLFVQKLGRLIDVSSQGQIAMHDVLKKSLERVDRDARGLVSLFPWARQPDEPRFVEIDPRRAFGKLVIVATGIPTASVADRMAAGESIADLAADYDLPVDKIEGAIRWEIRQAA
jgi:uncharacterized protein (DUF433 family)